jgi:hypothetical protein
VTNFPAETFDAPAVALDVPSLTYHTLYQVEGSERTHRASVVITQGYSTFEDIRKILAVRKFGLNGPEYVAKITVIETTTR